MLIYGPPKIGKTTFAHAIGKFYGKPCLFLGTEDGQGELDCAWITISSISGLERLLDTKLEPHRENLKDDYSCLVIDLLNDIDQMVVDFICTSAGINSLSELDHGTGWDQHGTMIKRILARLLKLGLPVKFIVHTKDKTIGRGKTAYIQQVPDLIKKTKAYIVGKVDVCGFISSDENSQLSITFLSNITNEAGSRFINIAKEYPIKDPLKTISLIDKDFSNDSTTDGTTKTTKQTPS